VKVFCLEVPKPIRPVSWLGHYLDTVRALELEELVRVTDHKIDVAASGIRSALL
jgi:hypothetical protein